MEYTRNPDKQKDEIREKEILLYGVNWGIMAASVMALEDIDTTPDAIDQLYKTYQKMKL
jgi:hypothetical protein